MKTNAWFSCRLTDEIIPLSHFWEQTIGSGHATLAWRANWQRQLQRCQAELGVRHVRFHGLLPDDVGTRTIQQDKPLDSFFYPDRIFRLSSFHRGAGSNLAIDARLSRDQARLGARRFQGRLACGQKAFAHGPQIK